MHKTVLNSIILSVLLIFAVSLTSSCQKTDSDGNNNLEINDEDNDNADPPSQTTNCKEEYSHELQGPTEEMDLSNWKLIWEDEFDYDDSKLEENWASQNGPSGHILCSRWRENSVVKDGVLELKGKKEQRGGQDWTCGNLWTKQTFGFGYYECKYKYAGASGANNFFWLFPRDKGINSNEVICEFDINEGHFPNEVNTNRHHWQNGNTENTQLAYSDGLSPAYSHSFNIAVKTKRIRFSSNNASHFHIREFSIYETNKNCYPIDLLSNSADSEVSGLNNLTRKDETQIIASGVYRDDIKASAVADGSTTSSWVSQKEGEKWLEFSWPSEMNVGHIQFINGWQSSGNWNALISDYKIEAEINGEWVEIASYDVKTDHNYA